MGGNQTARRGMHLRGGKLMRIARGQMSRGWAQIESIIINSNYQNYQNHPISQSNHLIGSWEGMCYPFFWANSHGPVLRCQRSKRWRQRYLETWLALKSCSVNECMYFITVHIICICCISLHCRLICFANDFHRLQVFTGSMFAALFDTAAAIPFFYTGRILPQSCTCNLCMKFHDTDLHVDFFVLTMGTT